MAGTTHRRSIVIVPALLLSLWLSAPGQTAPQPSDEANIRSLIERYFAAYATKDLAAISQLWSDKSADLASAKSGLQNIFSANDRIEVRNLELRRLAVDGERASAHAIVEVSAIDGKTGKLAAGFGTQNRSFQCVKEAGLWKIWREESSEADLAAKLVAAKNDEERGAILDAHKELATPELCESLVSQGRLFAEKGNYSAALIAFRQGRTVAEQTGNRKGLITALNGTGNVHLARGDLKAALELFQQALNLAEASGEKAPLVNLQNNLCIVQQRLGNYDQATEHCQRSLALAEAAGNKGAAASTFNNLGVISRQRGNHEAALEFYRKSLALYEAVDDKRGTARLLNNLGVVYNAMGNASAALQHYLRSLPIAEEIGNKAGTAGTLNNISMIYRALGNNRLALEYSQRSLALSEAIGDKTVVSLALEEIGKLHAQAGEHAQALEYYRKSLELAEQTGEKVEIAIRLVSVGNGYRNVGNQSQATEYYRRGLSLAESIGAPYTAIACLMMLGHLHLQQGKTAEALEFAERSVGLARQLGTYKDFWQALLIAGVAFRELGQPEPARKRFEEAISVIETARSQLTAGEREQAFFFATRFDPYIQMVMLMAEQGRTAEAFSFAERAKARVLLDVVRAGRVDVKKAMSEQEREQENRLKAGLNSLNAQLRRESQASSRDRSRLEELTATLGKARLAYESFQAQLYAAHPELRVRRGEAQPVAPEQAGELLTDGNTALLEYAVAEERAFLFVLTAPPQKGLQKPVLKVYDLKIKREELVDRVKKLNHRIANNDLEYSELSKELYNVLIAPARQQLQGKTRLVIVPEDILWETPFQALRSADGRFLIQDAAISYAPSLTVLREIIKSRNPKTENTLLAMGNPQLTGEALSRSKNVLMNAALEPLPEAERMVRTLGHIYGARAKLLVGAEASEYAFKAAAGKYRILQLATHGVINDASPMYSHVVLSQGEGGKEDGLLEAWEIMQLDLNADLAVLSACETARGRIGAGEGVIGLSWALFVAGCPTTVVSQWKVESSSTTELMLEFHRNLHAGTTKSEAMRRASLKLMANKRYSHPFYWAGFIVVGDSN